MVRRIQPRHADLYFHAIQSHREDRPAAGVAEAAAAYEPEMPFAGGRAFEIRKHVLEEFLSGRRAADADW